MGGIVEEVRAGGGMAREGGAEGRKGAEAEEGGAGLGGGNGRLGDRQEIKLGDGQRKQNFST